MAVDWPGEWLTTARRVTSPNQDPRPPRTVVDLLVVHGISLPPGKFGGGHVDRLFQNRLDAAEHPFFARIHDLRVSAHLMVERSGQLTQYVPFSQRAWHAGISSFRGRVRCNDFSIGIELEGTDELPYADAQYAVLSAFIRFAMLHWPAITPARIVGHCHVAPGRKTDPGPCFDWRRVYEMLALGEVG